MNEQNTNSKAYNPRDHLIKIKTKQGLKDYYPAAYRLYELNLRYENHSFMSEIIHLDLEHNFVIVKCTLYLGGDPDMSPRKTEALKGGLLSELDKVETAAKARCARDFGISTEFTLLDDLEAEQAEVSPTQDMVSAHAVEQVTKAERNGQVSNHLEAARKLFASTYSVEPDALMERWTAYKVSVLGKSIEDSDLTAEQLARVHGSIVAKQKEQAQQSKPARTASTVQAFFAKTYKVAAVDLDTRWSKFKAHVLGAEVADTDLTEEQLNQINSFVSQQYQKQQSQRLVQKVS
jgi:hypothetical protein